MSERIKAQDHRGSTILYIYIYITQRVYIHVLIKNIFHVVLKVLSANDLPPSPSPAVLTRHPYHVRHTVTRHPASPPWSIAQAKSCQLSMRLINRRLQPIPPLYVYIIILYSSTSPCSRRWWGGCSLTFFFLPRPPFAAPAPYSTKRVSFLYRQIIVWLSPESAADFAIQKIETLAVWRFFFFYRRGRVIQGDRVRHRDELKSLLHFKTVDHE